MGKSIVLICANERPNLGEQNYAIAMAAELEKRGITDICAMKIRRNENDSFGPADASSTLPVSNKECASLPEFSLDLAQEFISSKLRKGNTVEILGAGQSTLAELSQLAAMVENLNGLVRCSYVTHMIEDQFTLDTLVDNNMTVFAPATPDKLQAIETPEGKRAQTGLIKLHDLPAVPHTTTRGKVERDARLFLRLQ